MSLSNPKNPTFLLIPGSFSPPSFYSKIIPLLHAANYTATTIPLPSAGERPASIGPATFEEDASSINSALLTLVEEGQDVVLVMHSYGGYPGTEASRGLSKKEREKERKSGGIVRLVYLAAHLPAVGASIMGGLGENVPDSIKLAGDYMTLSPSDYETIFNDLPVPEAKHWMSQMLNHSKISFKGVLTHPGYKYIPTTYLLTENDKILPVEAQRAMIEFARREAARVDVVETEAGHCPMLSIPEKTVEVLIEAARGV